MFQNLHDDDNQTPYFQGGESENALESPQEEKPKRGFQLSLFSGNFLGMTAAQRFIVSVMLFMLVCIIGLLFLLVTETIVPY
jgi:hypothetical protein